MAAGKPTDIHVHTLPQWCHASVGLAQARRNYWASLSERLTLARLHC